MNTEVPRHASHPAMRSAIAIAGMLCRNPWVFVVIAGVIAHGILLFTDHVIWDGWIVDGLLSHVDGAAHRE